MYSHIDASHCHTATCNPPLYSSTGGLPADFIHPPDVRGCQRVSPKISPASGLRKRAGEFALLSDPFRRFDVTGQLTQGARQTLAVCFRFSPYFDYLSSARFATAGLAPVVTKSNSRVIELDHIGTYCDGSFKIKGRYTANMFFRDYVC